MLLHYVRFSDLIKDYAEEKDQQIEEFPKTTCHNRKALELAVGLIFEEYGCSKFDDKTCNKGE